MGGGGVEHGMGVLSIVGIGLVLGALWFHGPEGTLAEGFPHRHVGGLSLLS